MKTERILRANRLEDPQPQVRNDNAAYASWSLQGCQQAAVWHMQRVQDIVLVQAHVGFQA